MEVDATGIFLAAVVIGAQALSIWFIYWIWKTKRKSRARAAAGAGPADIENGEVRALATFTGLRGLPWVALASNSLNPVFRIENGQLAYRVIRARQRPLADISEVDVRKAYGTFNLIFAFRDTPLTFAANVGTAARGAQALALLPSSVPLTERARSALQAVRATTRTSLRRSCGTAGLRNSTGLTNHKCRFDCCNCFIARHGLGDRRRFS